MADVCKPFRSGRGGLPEEVRQLQAETIANLNRLVRCLNDTAADLQEQISGIDTGGGGGGGSGGSTLVAIPFGFDLSSSTTDCWVPFGPYLIETASTNAPRAYHVFISPIAGTIATIRATSESDPGTTQLQWYDPDGSTTVGVAGTGTPGAVPGTGGASTLYQTEYTFGTPVSVTAGQRLLLEYGLSTTAGEVAGVIEVTP